MASYKCWHCKSVNHSIDCVELKQTRCVRASVLNLCTAMNGRGMRCGNKALKSSSLCHIHATKPQAPRLQKTVMFHVFFLYALRKFADAKPYRKWIQVADTFMGTVSTAQVRAHYVTMRRWEEQLGRRIQHDKLFDVLNLRSLDKLIARRAMVKIGGILYRMQESGPRRIDEFPFPQTFVSLQAFDGFTACMSTSAMNRLCDERMSTLQVECMQRMLRRRNFEHKQ